MNEKEISMTTDFWTWLHITGEKIEESDQGLIIEARRLASEAGNGMVAVVAVGKDIDNQLEQLGTYGADSVYHLQSPHLSDYNGELFARALSDLLRQHRPAGILLTHNNRTVDLAGRVGAILDSSVITRAVDAHTDDKGSIRVVRPIANGYLFETIEAVGSEPKLLTFLPGALADSRPIKEASVDIQIITPTLYSETDDIKTVEIIAADPETLDIEDADIVVAGGRGVGGKDAFEIIQRLARAIGGSVAGTRPVIDRQVLSFERQIGQTGRTVSPRLIVNCGISGANEYTAGIEKSQLVIAVNSDSQARIFRFADLGIVGNLHEVLPVLVEHLEELTGHSDL
jgi:electron transfer flavoprotein alpha subunit